MRTGDNLTEVEIHEEPDVFKTPGFAWRVGLSIVVVFGWLAFLITWLFFYADRYGVFQNIAIILVSIIVGIGILAATWAVWGIRYAAATGHHPPQGWGKPRAAMVVNGIAGVGWVIFLIIWLFFYATKYNAYQNLAIFILSLLVLGAIMSSVWFVKWMRTRMARTAAPPSPPLPPQPPGGSA